MQINNSISTAPNLQKVKPSTSVDRQVIDARVKIGKNLAEDFTDSNQAPKNRVDRFDVDERALEVVSQKQVFKEQAKDTNYDQPTKKNSIAVSAYQAVDNQAARDKVQQTFGVDFFA
jgi:hypothetical protein